MNRPAFFLLLLAILLINWNCFRKKSNASIPCGFQKVKTYQSYGQFKNDRPLFKQCTNITTVILNSPKLVNGDSVFADLNQTNVKYLSVFAPNFQIVNTIENSNIISLSIYTNNTNFDLNSLSKMDSLKILELAIGGVGGFNLTMPPHLQYFSLYSDIEQIPNYILDSNLKSLKLSSDNLNNIDNIFKMKMLKDIDIVNTPLGQRLRKKDKNALAYVAAIRKQIPKLMLIYFYPDTIL